MISFINPLSPGGEGQGEGIPQFIEHLLFNFNIFIWYKDCDFLLLKTFFKQNKVEVIIGDKNLTVKNEMALDLIKKE